MREYLLYKMKCKNISREQICELIGVTEKTLRNKLSGVTDFTWGEAKAIRNKFFKEEEYEDLFRDEPKQKK